MLINILGGDGSGKTTQTALLQSWLYSEHGREARICTKGSLFSEQAGGESVPFCYKTYSHLLENYMVDLLPLSRALLQFFLMAASLESCSTAEIVILDGYWHKISVVESSLGGDLAWFNSVGAMFPQPELTIVLDVDPSCALSRLTELKPYECGLNACTPGEFIQAQEKMRRILVDWANDKRWTILDGAAPADWLHKLICEEVNKLLTSSQGSSG